MKGELSLKLRASDRIYSGLLAQWRIAISQVYEHRDDTGLSSYRVLSEPEDDELRFMAFGLNYFARLQHNFETGTIQYGIVKWDDVNGRHSWVPVVSVRLVISGVVHLPDREQYLVTEYQKAHLTIIAAHQEEFLEAAYGRECEE